MNGRQENERKIENKIKKILEDKPKILFSYYSTLNDKTAKTKLVYINYLIDFFEFLKERGIDTTNINSFKNVKKVDMDEYILYSKFRKRGDTTIENGKSIIRSRIFAARNFFDFLIDNEYIEKNPCEKVLLPKLNNQISVVSMTDEEVNTVKKRILDDSKYKERDYARFVLAIRVGLRINSLIEINIEDIDFNNNSIIVTEKGDKKREVYFGNDTKRALLEYLDVRNPVAKTNALFLSNRNRRMSYSVPKDILDKYASDFGKRITCHKMRSTCATNLYDKSGDIYLVADVLGHSNISNTRRYARISETKRKNAANILDEL